MQACLSTRASFLCLGDPPEDMCSQSSRTLPWSVHDLREKLVHFDIRNGTWYGIYSWMVMASSWQRTSTEVSFCLLHSPVLVLWKGRKTREAHPLLQIFIVLWIPFWWNVADWGGTQAPAVLVNARCTSTAPQPGADWAGMRPPSKPVLDGRNHIQVLLCCEM